MRLVMVASLVALSGCASILEGTTQSIAINTNPAGANCAVSRMGEVIGRVSPTPGAVTIKKTKQDITVECQSAGYETVGFTSESDFATPFFGNLIVGGPVGVGIDLATGAYNKYDAVIEVDFKARKARAINPSPREAAATQQAADAANAAASASAESAASERPLSSDHADRYQARRQQLRSKP
jgi:hypothetical protein